MSTPNILPTIFSADDRLSVPVRRMGMEVGRLGLAAEIAGTKLNNTFKRTSFDLNRISSTAFGVGQMMAGFGLAIVAPLGLATKAAIDFEQQMGNVSTLVDTAKENIGLMGDEVLGMSKKIPKPINDLTAGLYQIRSAGIEAGDGVNQAFGVLESSGKLAVAGLSSVEQSTQAVTSAMVSFKQQGLSSEQIANSFFLTVKEGKTKMDALNESFGSTALIIANAGGTLQEFNAATAAMTNAGFKASEAQTALRGATIALIKPTGEMVDVLGTMRLTGVDAGEKLIAKMGGIVPAMMAIKDASKGAGDNINKAFGRVQGLNALIALTGNQSEAFKADLKEQLQGLNALDTAFSKQSAKGAAQMIFFRNTIQRLGISIGTLLIPALNALVDDITPVIDGIADFAKNHKILSKIIVGSLGAIGLLALGMAPLAFGIGTITRGFALWKDVMIGWNWAMGVGKVQIIGLNGVLAETPGFAGRAALAMKGLAGSVTSFLVPLALLYGLYKTIQNEMNREEQETKDNPLGLNYYGKATDSGNKKILSANGLSGDDFGKQKNYYFTQRKKALNPGEYYNFLGGKNTNPFFNPNKNDSTGISTFDSTGINAQLLLNKQRDSDTSYHPEIPAPIAFGAGLPGGETRNSDQNITVTIENGTSYPVSSSANGSNKAGNIAVVVKSTHSRAA